MNDRLKFLKTGSMNMEIEPDEVLLNEKQEYPQ